MKLAVWQCDNCGKCFEFPWNEQPSEQFICKVPTWKFAECPGKVSLVAHSQTDARAEPERKP